MGLSEKSSKHQFLTREFAFSRNWLVLILTDYYVPAVQSIRSKAYIETSQELH